MPYTPPVGTVPLHISGSYTPPVGTVALHIGESTGDSRTAVIAGQTAAPHGAISARLVARAVVSGMTAAPVGSVAASYDPNLLSAVHAVTATRFRDARSEPVAPDIAWRDALSLPGAGVDRWDAATALPGAGVERWRDSARLAGAGVDRWRDAERTVSEGVERWQQALPSFSSTPALIWRDAAALSRSESLIWIMTLPRRAIMPVLRWADGTPLSRGLTTLFGDGDRLIGAEIERWRQAGYPSNAPNPGPAIPASIPTQWGTRLHLSCPLPGTALRIGRSPCPILPVVSIPILETYRVLNSCSLVRLPGRTPLPVTSLSVEVDVDSWCWSLTATLAGPAGWDLLAPQAPGFLPVEVEAMINGWTWQFLLDEPNLSRVFNRHSLSLKGRSRSAWLAEPFLRATSGVESNPRTAQQLAEQALDNLGWTLDWQLPVDWLVPGGLYSWSGTPIDQLIALIKPVDGCLYTDPAASIITAYLRYPTAAWLWDGQTADIGIPEAAVVSLERAPDNKPELNGCYVSGTIAGYTAWVKIAGTDGALVPAEPVVDPLLCHADALRARGIAILSASGPGTNLTAELLLTPEGGSGPGLLRPGLLAEIAGVRGMVRSVKVSAGWSNGLTVRQAIGIERREV